MLRHTYLTLSGDETEKAIQNRDEIVFSQSALSASRNLKEILSVGFHQQWQSCAAAAEKSSSGFRANLGGFMASTETASSWFEESGGFMFKFPKLFHEKINPVFREKTHRSSVRRYFQWFSSVFFLPTNFWWSKQWSSPEATERGDFPCNLQTS